MRVRGWLPLSLLLCGACSPKILTKPEVVRLDPPPALLRPCLLPPARTPATTGDVVDALLSWRQAARECEAQHRALVEWHGKAP